MHSAFGGNSQRTSAGIPGALTTSRADRIVVDMWGIVSLLGLSVAADPLRIGIAMLLTSGPPRPLINLVSFWLGSLAAGVALGVGAFVLFPELVSEALRVAVGWIASLTGGHAKLVAGTVALCVAAASAMRLARRPTRRPTVRATRGLQTSSGGVASRARDLLHGGRPWVSFTAGLSQGPAPVEYLAAISVIHASGAAIGTQLGASVAFYRGDVGGCRGPTRQLCREARTDSISDHEHWWLLSGLPAAHLDGGCGGGRDRHGGRQLSGLAVT